MIDALSRDGGSLSSPDRRGRRFPAAGRAGRDAVRVARARRRGRDARDVPGPRDRDPRGRRPPPARADPRPGPGRLHVAIGFPVPPSASTYAYATVAERRGVTVRAGSWRDPGRGERVASSVCGWADRSCGADQVLVAAGPWTPAAIDPTGAWLPIRPMWGVVVEIELAETAAAIASRRPRSAPSIGAEPSAIRARRTGYLRLQPDDGGWASARSGPRSSRRSRIPRTGRSVSSSAPRSSSPRSWTRRSAASGPARRPLSADGRPLIGAVPGVEGLFVCAGHGPWGISTGPASARLVVDPMLGRPVVDPGRVRSRPASADPRLVARAVRRSRRPRPAPRSWPRTAGARPGGVPPTSSAPRSARSTFPPATLRTSSSE